MRPPSEPPRGQRALADALASLVSRRPLAVFLALGAALLGLRTLAAGPVEAARPTLVVHAPTDASGGEAQRRVDDAILVEEGLRLGWASTDPVIRDRLIRNLRFVGEAGDDAALMERALAMGMARTDLVVRQRLIFRAERLLERGAADQVPSEPELAAHLAAYPDRFVRPSRVRFDQIYLSRDRRGDSAEGEARALAERLGANPGAAFDRGLGDPLATARPGRSATRGELARDYGAPFADAVFEAPIERLSGPHPSPFGWHLVLVREREGEVRPQLAEVRDALTASWRHAQRDAVRRRLLAQLRERYAVQVQRDLAPETHLSSAGEL
ncbi:MAG: peptidylprolyl isomerase [Myxococcota bacterium]